MAICVCPRDFAGAVFTTVIQQTRYSAALDRALREETAAIGTQARLVALLETLSLIALAVVAHIATTTYKHPLSDTSQGGQWLLLVPCGGRESLVYPLRRSGFGPVVMEKSRPFRPGSASFHVNVARRVFRP